MICGAALTSGAGMSRSGPTRTEISVKKRRDRPSSSLVDSFFGSTMTPPLPPPYGMPTTAHFLVIADAALGRSASEVVLDAVAGEDLHAPVVHVDGEVDCELAPGLTQDAPKPRVEVQLVGREVELPLRHRPCVDGGRGLLRGHGVGFLHPGRDGS